MNPILRLKSRLPLPLAMFIILGISTNSHAAPMPPSARLARVNLSGSVAEVPLPVFAHLRDASGQDYAWVVATDDSLRMSGLVAQTIVDAEASSPLYLARSRRSNDRATLPPSLPILHDDGLNLLLAPGTADELNALYALGYELRRLPSAPMVLAPPRPLAAPRLASAVSNAYVAQMVARVQSTNLLSALRELTGETPVHAGGSYGPIATRNSLATNSLDRALDYASSRLRAAGDEVTAPEWTALDWAHRSVSSRNLVAERMGTTAPDEIVVLCAHIDSEPEGPLAPGADDNASGAAAVLAAARAMRGFQFDRTLRFVLFTGEEQGILGSIAYASNALAAGDHIVGVLNLDMVAYDGNDDGHLNLTARRPSDPGHAADMELVAAFTNAVAFYGLSDRLVPLVYANSEGYSDHEPFWNVGIPAILAIEDWENGDITPHYHTTNDTIDTLNLPYFEAFAQASIAAAAHLAGPIGPAPASTRVSNAVQEVRLELEAALGDSVPVLGLVIQTPEAEYFASSAATPEQMLATNTTFRFASNTKNFTSTSVLLLQQMGLLNITNRIVDMIPGTDQPFIPEGPNWAIPNKDIITIEQLLRHSAGVYDVDNDEVPGCGGTSYTDFRITQDPAHQFTVEEMAGQAALHQLSYFAPDEGYHYSNTGYAMLAEIVGRVYSHYMGEPKTLSDFLYELNIVGPDIRFPNLATDTALPEPFMPGTERQPSNVTVVVSNCNMSAQVGEGNGYGTLPALNRHIRSTMRGEGVLSNDLVRLMQTCTSPHNANYALGCVWTPDIGFGHNGCRVGNLSFMAYNPDTDVSVAVYLGLVDYSDLMDSFLICYQGMYDAATRALEALGYPRTPQWQPGVSTNLNLAIGETNVWYFTAEKDVYYGITVSNQAADLLLALAPAANPEAQTAFTNGLGWICPAPGTYRLSVSAESGTDATLRLYNFTNTIAQTTALITNLMAQHDVPALSIALVDRNGVAWQQGFGMANREAGTPATEDTIYRIASCSKTFAAASILRLQDEGLLSIQDDVTHAVPAFSLLPRYPDQSITIRDLLAHQAQLPGSYFRHADSTVPYDGYYDMTLSLLAEDYLLEPPGLLQKYNNNGFTLLEGVVANVNTNHLGYADFAAAKLFQPMGMSNTTFRLSGSQTNLLAKVYWNGVLMPDEYVNTPGSGGAYSTAADMARYAQFLLGYGAFNGMRILSSNAVASLWSDQSDQVALVNKEGYAKSGLGWDQIADESFAYAGKMAWKDGDSLNYSAIICVMPEQGLAAVALNSIPGADTAAAPAAKLALKLALQERDGIPLPPTNPPAFPVSPVTVLTEQELAGITGVYSAAGGYDRVTGTVSSITWITDAGGSSPVRHEGLVPHQDGWFSTTNAPEFRLSFTNVDGRVILRNQVRYEEYLRIIVQAERFTPAPLSTAWSNRVGHAWITTDLEPDSYLWLLGFYPTLELDIADGVLSVYSAPCMTLQPQSDDLAFPFSMNAAQPSALMVKHTNGQEVIRYSGYDFRRVDDLPELLLGQSATGTLEAGSSAAYHFTIADPVWHGLYCSASNLILRQETTDLSSSGTYSLILQNPTTSAVPYSLRLYNYTNTLARVAALATNLMETYGVVGAGFSLVDGDHVVCQTGFGFADQERGIPATADTVFMIGSVSKTFGAIAAMQLAEEGLLDLDASITNALPGFAIQPRFEHSVITPRTILTHHSGLPGDIFSQGFSVRPIAGVPNDLQAALADESPLMPTNSFWAYNNSGFVMLGQMFRHIAGQELDVFARERLFDRIGMTNSSIAYDLPHIKTHLARPYIDGVLHPDEYVNMFFAGAIYSTPSDMSRYLRMLLNEGMGDNARVLSPDSIHAMATQQNAGIPLDQFNSLLNMGIGFILDPPTLRYMGKVLWHDGETVYFRSLLRAATDARIGCFFSSNSDEGGLIKFALVDSALKWAYEEKTGISPLPPADPGEPAAALPPPELIELATNGVFVTGPGYSRFAWDGSHLLVDLNAQADGSVAIPMQYRENGWFTPTNAFIPQFAFSETDGHIVSIYKDFADGVTNLVLFGERSPGIESFHPAWSNRLGRWWATNMHPDDISWRGEDVRLTASRLELLERDNMLLAQTEMLYVMSATNDALAFAAGLGRNKGSSLRAPDADTLAFMGVTYRAEAGIPLLAPGTATNGTTAADEPHWFRIPAAASPLTFDLATDHDLTAYIYTEDNDCLGQANRAHAFHLDATNAQPLVVAIVRNGANPGPWRLATHTNPVPFYAQLAPADWPAQLVENAHRYPNADFGHVFVPENRTAPSPHVVKIAVVRMVSTNPAARPLLFLNGGPGDSGIRCSYQYFLQGFSDTHHVYLIDPRGVNLSQPSLAFDDDESPADLQYRLRMLQQADLSAIHTVELARDVANVAAAFDITEADLLGQSYGTLLAQVLMRRAPSWLRSVVLDGVVAPNIPGLSHTGPVRHNALEAFFADVATNTLYPDFADALYGLAESLQANPATVPIYGEPNLLNGVGFLDAVLNQLTSTDLGTRERIPGIVWRAAHNETAALAELFEFRKDTNVVFDSIHDPAQQILVIRHDMLPFDSLEAATNACAGLHPLLAELSIGFMKEAVEAAALFDDYGQADPSFTNSLVSPIPTLVVNGRYDTQTGTNWAAEVASHLPNARLAFLPAVGHGVLFATNGCALQIMRDFFANPAQPPDASCAQSLVPDFPSPWPDDAEILAPGSSLAGSVTNPGVASWYELAVPVPAAPVGGISDIHCRLRISQLPDPFLVRIYGASDGSRIAQQRGPGTLDFVADATPFVLAIQPATFGVQTGDFEIEFSVPLLVRKLDIAPPNIDLVWQGPTGATVSVEAAPFLANPNAFAPLIENLAASNLLQNQALPLGPDPSRFFRVIEQTEPTNRLGSAVLLSDIHLCPFTEQRIAADLLARPVAEWDELFALSTNGLFTPDATGGETTSPLLLQSALLNAKAACPDPDAIIIPGDFVDYDLISSFIDLVPLATPEQGKQVLLKTVQYAHGKILAAFPEVPIFFALGNNDTYLEDYDIAVSGDEFYAATAPTFHSGALTNLIAYADFAATYTNAGCYAVPFGNGRVIALQTLYFSANYPRGTNSGWAQLERLEIELQAAATSNRPAWIVLHIPPGIDSYATWQQWKTGNVSAAVTDWNELFIEPFCQIVAAHSNHIAGIFAGHYHNRGWQLIADPATTNAVATLHGANGILYNHGNNPGFTVLTYDRSTLALLAENTYSLDVATHTGTLDPTVPWSIRHSQNQGCGIPDLSPASLEGAWTAMADFKSSPAQHFNREYSGDRTPYVLTASNWPVYLNAIRHTLSRQFLAP